MKPEQHFHGLTHVTLTYPSEWGFIGFIDLVRYDANLGGAKGSFGRIWSPEQVLERALRHMSLGTAYFWGSAEADDRISINAPDFDDMRSTARQCFSGQIDVSSGRLCLTSFKSLAAIAQLADEDELPFWSDVVWDVHPGWYALEVLQFSSYDGSAQCVGDVDLTFDDDALHYAIRIEAIRSGEPRRVLKMSNQPEFFYPKRAK